MVTTANVFKEVSINRCEAYSISVHHFYGHMDPPNHCIGNRNKAAIEARDYYRSHFHLDYLCWCVDCPSLSWYLCVVDGRRLAKETELCSWVVAQCQCHYSQRSASLCLICHSPLTDVCFFLETRLPAL